MDDNLQNELASLLDGTQAHLVSDTSSAVMHDRPKVELPIPQLNCIYGGGIPLGIIVEAFGDPASGKSSTWYQTMGNFQKQYPNGISIIVDTEASVDKERMPFMGCDPNKTLRIPAMSVEEGFNQVFKILDKKEKNEALKDLPVFILWDTIGINATSKQIDTGNQFSGGMLEKAKTLKFELSLLLPRIEKQPILVVLLNQVTTKMGMYGSSLTSGGGWGIKHNAHVRLQYKGGKTDYDGIYAHYKHSTVDIVKSKISPLFTDLNIAVDITKGGVVDPIKSFIDYTWKLGYVKSGSWCNFSPIVGRHPEYEKHFWVFNKSFRYKDLLELANERPKLMYYLQLLFIEDISEHYSYQAQVCKPYKEHLIELLNAPEPYVNAEGDTVDLWSGEVIEKHEETSVNQVDETNQDDNSDEINQDPES